MDLASDLAENALDGRVDVLVVGLEIAGHHRREGGGHLRELVVVEDAGGVQALGMAAGGGEVVGEELGVVGFQKRPDLGSQAIAHPARPERHAGEWEGAAAVARCRAAVSSVSSDASRTNPSAASCGNVSPGEYDASVSA